MKTINIAISLESVADIKKKINKLLTLRHKMDGKIKSLCQKVNEINLPQEEELVYENEFY